MFLILPTSEATERNRQEAVGRGCDSSTIEWWESKDLENGTTALFVNHGDGLSEDELAMCVNKLPND